MPRCVRGSIFYLINMLDANTMTSSLKIDDIRKIVGEELDVFEKKNLNNLINNTCHLDTCHSGTSTIKKKTYASALDNAKLEIKLSHGPTVELDNIISFFVVPDEASWANLFCHRRPRRPCVRFLDLRNADSTLNG